MPYREERALEDAAFGQGFTPTRIFSLMLPVWQVEVKATVTEGRPYELIERFLERGIAEGGLGTVPELAAFFALDEALVDRAMRFLAAIGHVSARDGRLWLTDLGVRSHRDQRCYTVEREDRRKLYFEAFSSQPLSRPYYDTNVVTLLSLAEAKEAKTGNAYAFPMLVAVDGFRHEALAELAGLADRDHYNLPDRIDRPESLRETIVHLPLFVVRARDLRGRVRHLAYSQAGDSADPELSELCERNPDIAAVLDSEERESPPDRQRTRMEDWLKRRNLDGHRVTRNDHGAWEVTLPAEAFEPAGTVPVARLGSFVVLGTEVLHILCEDEETRRRTVLTRMDAYLTARFRLDAADVAARIARIGNQLGFAGLDPEGLRRLADDAGMASLAERLAKLKPSA